ncbi:hypothetical protein EOJ36_01380 [Sandaracinomonas limnophila]|uniref:Mannosyltransferase n=1 Tax=Sandaracinomonas limnophila TaxID=1862386 RepID=A0A437PWP1_9BACT|nr:hypothetical protein [Sandaracinomonas limnophila]RVU26676.1 hypothetical protein EOJ36_01380 [Sandaracinomonas limnophila]
MSIGILVIFFFQNEVILNFPNSQDDYNFLSVVYYFEKSEFTLWELIKFLFEYQAFPHKIILSKLYLLVYVKIFSSINFKILTLAINLLQNIFFVYFSAKILNFKKQKITFLLPFIFIYFNLDCHIDNLGLMSAGQHFSSLLFLIIYAYYLPRKIYFALIISIICPFISGEGLVILPLTILYLLLKKQSIVKYYSVLAVAIIIFFIFYNFPSDGINPNDSHSNFLNLWSNKIQSFFLFLGGAFPLRSNGHPFLINTIWGIISLISFFYLKYLDFKKTKKLNIESIDLIILTLIGMAAMVSIARGDGNELLNTSLALRFKFYHYIFCLFIFYKILLQFPRLILPLCLTGGFIFFYGNYIGINNYYLGKSKLISDEMSFKRNGSFYSFNESGGKTNNLFSKTNFKFTDKLLDTNLIIKAVKFKNYSKNIESKINFSRENSNTFKLTIFQSKFPIKNINKNAFLIILKNENIKDILPLNSFLFTNYEYLYFKNLNLDKSNPYSYFKIIIDSNFSILQMEKIENSVISFL